MTEFITRNYGQKEFEVIIKTDSKEHYKAAEDFARKLIDNAKPQTNADRIRAMSDEELANWLARTQYADMMEAAEIFGAKLPFKEETLKGTEKECLEWLQSPAEEE